MELGIEEALKHGISHDAGPKITDEQGERVLAAIVEQFKKYYGKFYYGIITSTQLEREAMVACLVNVQEINSETPFMRIWSAEIHVDGQKKHDVAISTCAKPRHYSSAFQATHMYRSFPSMREFLVIGTSSGIAKFDGNGVDVRLGDVVVSYEEVQQLDLKSLLPIQIIEVSSLRSRPSHIFTHAVNEVEGDIGRDGGIEWRGRITKATNAIGNAQRPLVDPRQGTHEDERAKPISYLSTVASVAELLKEAPQRAAVASRGVAAIDWHHSGIADAAEIAKFGYMVVRGISDYGDGSARATWERYSACAAAGYAAELLAKVPARY